MNSPLQAPRMRAAARRVKAGGERFLGGVLPGATARRLQVAAFADEWAAANLDARQTTGPLWVVLGDSVSQGIGATTRESGYVGVMHEMLRRRDAWRVINLSKAGAGVLDVLARQLPELASLTADEPAALVTCLIGAEDMARRTPGLDTALRQVISSLPVGSVVGLLPHGPRAAGALNSVIREESERHAMRIAVLPPRLPGPLRGRDIRGLGDVGHAAWARAVLSAADGPVAQAAPATDPRLPVVPPVDHSPPTDPALPVVPPLDPAALTDPVAPAQAEIDTALDTEIDTALDTAAPAPVVEPDPVPVVEPEPVAEAVVEPEPEPASVERVSVEPAFAESASVEPASVEQASVEQASVEQASVEPAFVEEVEAREEAVAGPVAAEDEPVADDRYAWAAVRDEDEDEVAEPVAVVGGPAVDEDPVAEEPLSARQATDVEAEPLDTAAYVPERAVDPVEESGAPVVEHPDEPVVEMVVEPVLDAARPVVGYPDRPVEPMQQPVAPVGYAAEPDVEYYDRPVEPVQESAPAETEVPGPGPATVERFDEPATDSDVWRAPRRLAPDVDLFAPAHPRVVADQQAAAAAAHDENVVIDVAPESEDTPAGRSTQGEGDRNWGDRNGTVRGGGWEHADRR